MPFPKRQYFTLEQVAQRWGTDNEQVKYSMLHDGLEACCWFDRRKVMVCGEEEGSMYEEPHEGYVGIYDSDVRRVFRRGDAIITRFYDLECKWMYYYILDNQRDVVIHPEEVMIRLCACREFEKQFGLIPSYDDTLVIIDNHTYYYNGELLSFGPMQKAAIKVLIKAKQNGNPWVQTKMLLEKVGSSGDRVRDIFKGNDIWKELFESDKKGHYRLRENLAIEFQASEAAVIEKVA